MRRILLVPLAAVAALTLLPAALSEAAPAPAASSATRDITKIQKTDNSIHAGSSLKPFATTSSFTALRDVYPVGKTMGVAVDRQKGTPARSPNRASNVRTLPVSIWYPAASGAISKNDIFWATARHQKFPLIVFAAGFNASPDTYQPFLHTLAAQGYIVAAPLFPIEGQIPGMAAASRSNAEMLNQMYDMSAVITQMLRYAKTPGNFLNWSMNQSQIGVVGHSDGAMTVAGMTISTSYADSRVKTAVVLSGAGPFGLKWNQRKVVPLMIEQATKDPYNAVSSSNFLFNAARGPRAYLTLQGVYHIWPFNGTDKIADLTRRAVVAQLNGQLKAGGATSFWQLAAAGNTPGYTSLKFGS
jgi:fermentation-respiration switch protein FrsA (DUF1100 family)